MSTSQAPIGSGFGPATTAQEVIGGIDLTGKTAIVTGGHAGLGLETARVLQSAGARIVVPARDVVKATTALASIPGVLVEPMDLMDPDSIDAFAERFLATGEPLHLLINNAGIMAHPLARDTRGYESQFATNHLGHFQLTVRLWPALTMASGARVVALSSRGHRFSGVDFEDPNFEHRPYDPWIAYGQSKSANVLFAVHLDSISQKDGVRAFAVHPGGIVTDLARYVPRETLLQMGAVDANGEPVIEPEKGRKNLQQGAATTVWCATSPRLEGLGGVYCEDCDIAPASDGAPRQAGEISLTPGAYPWATDPGLAERLWRLSEELTGISTNPV
ncbi:SDR family NAD(P)-dependent oxidoreductase [bacterium]|nr:MAG: SDR family NAD(P)-dependent oxidoreductase [bacterium]